MAEQGRTAWSGQAGEALVDEALRRLLEIARRDPDGEVSGSARVDEDSARDPVIDELLDAIMTRSLRGLQVDAVYIEATQLGPDRWNTPRGVLVTATGLDAAGDPEPLDFVRGEDVTASTLATALLVRLRDRGLQGVRQVLSSEGTSLADVVPAVFPGAGWLPLARGERPDWLGLPGD